MDYLTSLSTITWVRRGVTRKDSQARARGSLSLDEPHDPGSGAGYDHPDRIDLCLQDRGGGECRQDGPAPIGRGAAQQDPAPREKQSHQTGSKSLTYAPTESDPN